MPFYDYHCDACGHEFEAMQKVHATPLTDCPACGQTALKKLLSAPAGIHMADTRRATPVPPCQTDGASADGGTCKPSACPACT